MTNTSNTPNIPLLRKTMERIEAYPDEWDQTYWAVRDACSTTMCFAGTAVWLAGHQFAWHDDDDGQSADMTTNHRVIVYLAREELGLTDQQADDIFWCMARTPAELRAEVECVVGERL